jgi:hypothetical protein
MQSALEKQAEFFQEAVRPLHEVIVFLHGWMLAIGGFLERAGASGVGLHGCCLPILWLRLMLAKWARVEWAFMAVSLLVLGRARIRSFDHA